MSDADRNLIAALFVTVVCYVTLLFIGHSMRTNMMYDDIKVIKNAVVTETTD